MVHSVCLLSRVVDRVVSSIRRMLCIVCTLSGVCVVGFSLSVTGYEALCCVLVLARCL